jgi:excisionase family DNA binding protein
MLMTAPKTPAPAGLSTEAFAQKYGIARQTVYAWARRGELRLTKVGPGTTRILREDEDSWLERRRTMSVGRNAA